MHWFSLGGILLLLLFCSQSSLSGQTAAPAYLSGLLPQDAKIIETADIKGGTDRLLVLWMKNPQRVMATWDSGADFLYGDHWVGPTNLSLINRSTRKLINTIQIQAPDPGPLEAGTFALPFFTVQSPYHVPKPNRKGRGVPQLLRLRDLTGEGIAGQFTVFDYIATEVSNSAVFGYCRGADQVVQYPIEVVEDKFRPVTRHWVTQVFAHDPIRPGEWKFTWEAGHGSWKWIDESVLFDRVRQTFVERRVTRPYPGFSSTHCELDVHGVPEFLRVVGPTVSKSDTARVDEVRTLLEPAPANEFVTTGAVVRFAGKDVLVNFEFLKDESGNVAIRLESEDALLETLRPEIKRWCKSE